MQVKNSRYPSYKVGQNGETLCRGCGNTVPKGRRTWCSWQCYHLHEPRMVIASVKERDHGICARCGCDTEALRKWHWEHQWDIGYKIPKGFEKASYKRWWHADHIKEYCDGGETILENMQTLCIPCHKAKTREWRMRRKGQKQYVEILLPGIK